MRLSSPSNIKRGLIVLGLAGLVGALGWALWPKPVPVEVAEVRKGPLVVTVDEEGKTRIKDVYAVSAPITGKLVRLSLEAGDRVKKDVTIVAIIEPMAPPFLDVRATRELEAQIEAAKAAVALAEAEINQAAAELEFAESELKRASDPDRHQDDLRARPGAGAHRRRYAARGAGPRQVQPGGAQARAGERAGAPDRPEEAWKGEVPAGCCVDGARARQRPGPAAHPGERAGGGGRDAAGRDRRSRQPGAGRRAAVGRCRQGARGRDRRSSRAGAGRR